MAHLGSILMGRYSNQYLSVVLKIYSPKQRRRKMPWYDFLLILVGGPMFGFLRGWLSDLDLSSLTVIFGAMGGGFVAGYLALRVGKWLSLRFPRLKSEHVGYFDR